MHNINFQPRTLESGRVCCSQPYALCDACCAHFGISEDAYLESQQRHLGATIRAVQSAALVVATASDYAPSDSYQRHIAALRAANVTDSSRFEDAWKRDGLAATEATRAALDAGAPMPRLTTAELSAYAPPDGWALALRKEKGR